MLALQRYHDDTPKDVPRCADAGNTFIIPEMSTVHYDVKVIAECLKDIKTVALWGKVSLLKSVSIFILNSFFTI